MCSFDAFVSKRYIDSSFWSKPKDTSFHLKDNLIYCWKIPGAIVKLDEYLFRTKTTKKAFAEKIGISQGHLQHILSGIKNPSVKLAKKIEEFTEGRVSKEEVLFPEEYKEKEL